MSANPLLIDAQAMHSANPKTFEVPDSWTLADIVIGDLVKVGVDGEDGWMGERFWVRVTGWDGKTGRGTITHKLTAAASVYWGVSDLVYFDRCNIMGTE